MANAWMKLVMKTKRAHPKMSLGEAMKAAKKSYKGGATVSRAAGATETSSIAAAPVGGRKTRKARKGGKKTRKASKSRKH